MTKNVNWDPKHKNKQTFSLDRTTVSYAKCDKIHVMQNTECNITKFYTMITFYQLLRFRRLKKWMCLPLNEVIQESVHKTVPANYVPAPHTEGDLYNAYKCLQNAYKSSSDSRLDWTCRSVLILK